MAPAWWIWYTFSHTFLFKFAICFVSSINLGETCNLRGLCGNGVVIVIVLNSIMTSRSFGYVLWRQTMHEWIMNIHYQTSFTVTHHKHNTRPLKTMRYVWLCSEDARVCAKWHWGARDCNQITGLRDRQSNPGDQSSSFQPVSFRAHTCVFAFISHILCKNGIEMALVWWIWYTFCYNYFNFAICFIASINLGRETYHLRRCDMVTVWRAVLLLCCYDCDSTQCHYDVTWFELRTVPSHNACNHPNSQTWSTSPQNNKTCVITNWITYKTEAAILATWCVASDE